MDPTTKAALISGGASIAGSLLGGKSKQSVDYRGAKKGIRWRVRDAQLAGIHPLYAMGAPGIGQGVVTSQGPSQAGAAIKGAGSAAAAYYAQQAQKAQDDANLEYTRTQTDYVREQIEASRQARKAQRAGHANLSTAETFPAMQRFEEPMYTEMYDPRTGQWHTRTHPDSAVDLGEVLGPYLDMWMHNPEARPQIEQRLGEMLKDLPGIRRLPEYRDPITYGRDLADDLKSYISETYRRSKENMLRNYPRSDYP